VESAAKRFADNGAAKDIPAADWSSHEWRHFIQSLPSLRSARMAQLDAQFHLSETGNSEVLAAWLLRAIESRYQAAYPAIENFLTRQGRRKFLKPLYEALSKNPDDLVFAQKIYAQ